MEAKKRLPKPAKSKGRQRKRLDLIGRPQKIGPFFVQKFLLKKAVVGNKRPLVLEKSRARKLVLSIPKLCGSSVQRNRLRRILKEQFKTQVLKLPKEEGLWIRLSNYIRLPKKIDHTFTSVILEKISL